MEIHPKQKRADHAKTELFFHFFNISFVVALLFQVLLHHSEEFPFMTDQGFALTPGMHTLVSVNRREVSYN